MAGSRPICPDAHTLARLLPDSRHSSVGVTPSVYAAPRPSSQATNRTGHRRWPRSRPPLAPLSCGTGVSLAACRCVKMAWTIRRMAVRVRILTVCLLVLGGWLWSLSLAAEGSFAAPVEAATYAVAVQQQPLSTIPPLPQSPAQRFSTIPPLPPTPTPIRPSPTQVQAPTSLPTRAVPAAPTPIPLRPTSTLPPAPS